MVMRPGQVNSFLHRFWQISGSIASTGTDGAATLQLLFNSIRVWPVTPHTARQVKLCRK
jgi:hypothetical protein